MKKNVIFITIEPIKLGQVIKYAGFINNGSEARLFLNQNDVFVNNEKENRRGRKIYFDFVIKIDEKEFFIIKKGDNDE